MTEGSFSVAMTEKVAAAARRHLLRADGQEDLCFALWRPSRGATRSSALIHELLLPRQGERNVHGNVSFDPAFLERALTTAAALGSGLALMHSHPGGRGWQGMSRDDIAAEYGKAGAVFGATAKPFVGLTLAGDETWSARFWERTAPRTYERRWCRTVRVVGDRFDIHYMDELAPRPRVTNQQIRTVSAWGDDSQADLARLRVAVVGAGSVGGIIADILARTGFQHIDFIDFDIIEDRNLDRLIYATRDDIGMLKTHVLAAHLKSRATAEHFVANPIDAAVFEEHGFRAALDADLIFSCVDRPWGRHVLNLIAYAHLIPVIDGGIAARTNRHGKIAAADWRAHTATVGRPCLSCLGQYDPAFVQLEREGFLDDQKYIDALPKDHPLKARENVYAFAMSCASFQVLQALAYTLAPQGLSNPGPQLYHFVGSFMEQPDLHRCKEGCSFPSLVATGDLCAFSVTGPRPANMMITVAKSAISERKKGLLGFVLQCGEEIRRRLPFARKELR